MQWSKHPEAVELLRKIGDQHTDYELAKMFKERYPEEHITHKSVQYGRQSIGMNKPNYFRGVPKKSAPDADTSAVLGWLLKEPMSVGAISRRLDRSKETVIKIIDALQKQGYDLTLEPETRQVAIERELKKQFKPLEIKPLYRHHCKFMLISDTHLCSRHQQLSILHTAYKIAEDEKVSFTILPGDIQEGDGTLYRGQKQEIFLPIGADRIRDYVIEHYPHTNKFKTYLIGGGSHDWVWMRGHGYNMVKNICKERGDLVYRGDVGARFTIKKLTFEVLHPTGGVPYTRSYRPSAYY